MLGVSYVRLGEATLITFVIFHKFYENLNEKA